MRYVLSVAALLVASSIPVMAEDTKPSVDLVASFILGIADGATLGAGSSTKPASIKQTGPGAFEGTPQGTGNPFSFLVVEKAACVFDIHFTDAGQARGGIELDMGKLTSVAYESTGGNAPIFDYRVTLTGKDNLVQILALDGKLSHAALSSTLSTSLTADQMQAAVTALQAGACPPA